jgi:hypothetical protein
VVKDAAGNAVSGLANSAFGFNLSGGGSADNFGTVTETATKGTYTVTVTFTGTTSGTASSVTATINGVAVAAQPAIKIIPGAVSPANSTVSFATSTVAPGGTDTVTIVVEDAAGNAITGLSSSSFGFSLSDGTSAGTFGIVTETTTKGTYTVTFTGITAGTASTLTTTVTGIILDAAPIVTVLTVAVN